MTFDNPVTKTRTVFDNDIGKWVIYHIAPGLFFAGKVVRIEDDYAYLNPNYRTVYPNGKPKDILSDLEARIYIGNPIPAEITNEKDLQDRCDYSNSRYAKDGQPTKENEPKKPVD